MTVATAKEKIHLVKPAEGGVPEAQFNRVNPVKSVEAQRHAVRGEGAVSHAAKQKQFDRVKQEEQIKSQLRIKLLSYDSKVVDASCRQLVEIATRSGVEIIGPVPLPTEIRKYTVNRSTFVHKNAREQFEMRVHKRLIEIPNPNPRFIEALRDLTLPTGVEIEVKTT